MALRPTPRPESGGRSHIEPGLYSAGRWQPAASSIGDAHLHAVVRGLTGGTPPQPRWRTGPAPAPYRPVAPAPLRPIGATVPAHSRANLRIAQPPARKSHP